MTAVMSIGMLLINNPHDIYFKRDLLNNFLLGCLIAVPAGYVIVPAVEWLTDHFVKNNQVK